MLVDKKLRAWLMEVNANPSLNMFLERELPSGESEKTLSELDKYVKTLVIADALRIVKSKEPRERVGCFERILPRGDAVYEKYFIWEEARKVFEKLGGVKSPEFLSSSQF